MTTTIKQFSFTSLALSDSTFDVVSFSGSEGLSKLYHFEIILLADDPAISLEKVVQSRGTLIIHREGEDILFNGILKSFDQLDTVQGRTQYRATIAPALWRLTLTHHNQIFLGKTVPEIIEAALADAMMTTLDYEMRLSSVYPQLEYVCQYDESHAAFISRLMEREGIYYYFEQDAAGEKLIITDILGVHGFMSAGSDISYNQVTGLDESYREEVVKGLVCNRKLMPRRVILKDYNYRLPALDLQSESIVYEQGQGDVYIYGDHFQTTAEGEKLAKIRAQELLCRATTFHGESLIPYLRPGYIFNLTGHNRTDFNAGYLTTDITHNGDQSFMFTSGLATADSPRDQASWYRNSFTAIPSTAQFRPERITHRSRFHGTIHAHIDAAGSGQYAEIDDQGRYKVKLPFDLNDPAGGKASSWIRMSQPYAGDSYGMHFPLHKGTEVLLTFIDGDPDRPIIAGSVPNPLTQSPVTSANNTQSRITTAGGNKMHIEDQQGSERILLHTPKSNTWLRMGTPNDPPGQGETPSTSGSSSSAENSKPENEEETNLGFKLSSADGFEVECSFANKLVVGEQSEIIVGSSNEVLLGTEISAKVGAALDIFLGVQGGFAKGTKIDFGRTNCYSSFSTNELIGNEKVELKAGGTSVAVEAALTAILIAGVANTAVAATMGAEYRLNKVSKDALIATDVAMAGVLAAVAALLPKLDVLFGSTFWSSIDMNATEIEINAPKIKCEALLQGISMKALAGGIKSTAVAGGITNSVTAGGISNSVAAGGITSKVTAGDIGNTAVAGNITNTAAAGSINNTALKISNEAETAITNSGRMNTLSADAVLSMTSSGRASLNADAALSLQAGTKMGLTAPNISIDAGASVAVTAAGVIKLG